MRERHLKHYGQARTHLKNRLSQSLAMTKLVLGMRPIILFVVAGLGVLAVGGWPGAPLLAAEDSKDLPATPIVRMTGGAQAAGITRVAIAVSGGPVAYTDQSRQDPPAIVIEFRSRNVIAALESSMVINAGIIKEIQSDYYPKDRRALKSLTLTLVQPAAYTIAQQTNQIVVDIDTPASVLPGRMAVGQGVTVLGIEAKETLIQRLKVMEGALQRAGPQATQVVSTPKPVVVTTPVEIPKPVFQPEPKGEPVSKGGRGGFGPGLLLGIGGTLIAVVGWRRRRKAAVAPGESAELVSIAQGTSVYEQLILKAMQRQGHTVVGSKAIADLGTLWIVQKDDQRQGLVCLGDGGFLERKVLEPFCKALQQESLRSGTVYALGAFTAPAQAFAKENQIHLISREEVLKLMEVELKGPVLTPDVEQLSQQLVKSQSELDQTHAKIQALEQELSAQKKKWEEAEWYLGEERTKKQALEQQVAELTKQLAAKDELYAKLVQEADQLKAKSAEVDQRLAAEQEKRAQLETQIAKLGQQLKAQAATVADLPAALAARAGKVQLIQESTEAAKETIKAVTAEEPKVTQEVLQGQEHRKWPRLDLSRHKGKGVLVRATSNDGEPMNGDARNLSTGGLCMELPSGEQLADEFELKLFLPDRTKPIEAIGKLMWKGRGSRRRMGQLGIAFSAVNAADQETITRFVEQRTSELVTA